MADPAWLAEQFEHERGQLRGVAYRMLGSLPEAEDAVQEAWLRLSRTGGDDLINIGGWLRTVVSRVCLDMLRARHARREETLDAPGATDVASHGADPERETELASSVGLAMLVVLDTLAPAERLAFVLHDMFGVSFDEIAGIVDRSPEAARQLASRARRRVQGSEIRDYDASRQRAVVEAFLKAARQGDFEALLTILDPDVVLRSDRAILPPGAPTEQRGAETIARRAVVGRARAAQPVLVNGEVGVIIAPRGKLLMVLRFTLGADDRVVAVEAIGDPDRLRDLELAVLH